MRALTGENEGANRGVKVPERYSLPAPDPSPKPKTNKSGGAALLRPPRLWARRARAVGLLIEPL